MTLGLVNEASNVAFIVSGEAKGEALKTALGDGDNPAGLVRPANGRLLWFVDRGAARLL